MGSLLKGYCEFSFNQSSVTGIILDCDLDGLVSGCQKLAIPVSGHDAGIEDIYYSITVEICIWISSSPP